MENKFSTRSLDRLKTCHEDIQLVMQEVIRVVDFSVVFGHRGEEEQNKAYPKFSSKQWPDSKHNKVPALAIDVLPYPSGWPQDTDEANVKSHKIAQFYYMAGIVMLIAKDLNISLRWGGDWDMDKDFLDQTFDDLAHFELILGE